MSHPSQDAPKAGSTAANGNRVAVQDDGEGCQASGSRKDGVALGAKMGRGPADSTFTGMLLYGSGAGSSLRIAFSSECLDGEAARGLRGLGREEHAT